MQYKLPLKLNDLGSLSIGNNSNFSCLCDFGTSINLMPISIYRKLGLEELKDTIMFNQLEDRSIKHHLGVVENLLIKVGKLIFPVDFIVLDIEEYLGVSLILGRHFLFTSRIIMDFETSKLTLTGMMSKRNFRFIPP